MTLLSRRDLGILAAAAAAASSSAHAQVSIRSGPGAKYNIIIDNDLEGTPLHATRLTIMDVAPGTQIPPHYHPAAQEIAFGMDGVLTMQVGGRNAKTIKAGDVVLIPAGVPHLPVADASERARVLFIHSIIDKTKPFIIELRGDNGPE
jgi:quercetin dioxygenase-like cupin family protein